MMGDFSDKKIAAVAEALTRWTLKPTGSEGYRTAEVTLGGVDTGGLNSTTMEARQCPGSISSAKWSTSPAGSAATISMGLGQRLGRGPGGLVRAQKRPPREPASQRR